MVSTLRRPSGAPDDPAHAQQTQQTQQHIQQHTQNLVTPSPLRGPGAAGAGSTDATRDTFRLPQTRPSRPQIVLPKRAREAQDVQRQARNTWTCLTRPPGTPWRASSPVGTAMPARWATPHSRATASAIPAAGRRPANGAMPVDYQFGGLSLSPPIRRAVWEAGYRTPMPIQEAAIPHLLAGKDCVGQAQTGTGKTAAFGIPIVERVDPARRVVQAIVLLPTRELCRQVAGEIERLGAHRGVEVLPVYGGEGMERQLRALAAGVHVVVGTPGRVQDHIWRGTLVLENVHIAILDEADEMLDIGFAEAIEAILRCVPKERQTALFSATIPPFVHTLVRRYLRDPEWISTVDRSQADATRIPSQIRQSYVHVAERDKVQALEELVRSDPGYNRVLVFRRMKVSADRLASALMRKGYSVRALHGDLPQGERNRVLDDFRAGRIRFLVATNVAARGLDISDVSHVLNFDLPDTPEEYTHRIGRTGRAGKAGTAVSFVGEWDVDAFDAIRSIVGDSLEERPLNLYAHDR